MESLAWWVLKSKVFAQKSTVFKWNCCILWIDIVPGPQKVPKLYFQSQFSMSKINRNFSKKKFIKEYQFRRTFFVKKFFSRLNFWTSLLSRFFPNFWWTDIPLGELYFSSLGLCWFLANNVNKGGSLGLHSSGSEVSL